MGNKMEYKPTPKTSWGDKKSRGPRIKNEQSQPSRGYSTGTRRHNTIHVQDLDRKKQPASKRGSPRCLVQHCGMDVQNARGGNMSKGHEIPKCTVSNFKD